MNRTCILLTAGLVSQAALMAQGQPATAVFQQAEALVAGRGGGRGAAQPAPRTEPGKPFSATATTQTTQTLADGTRVTQTTTMLEYRDAEGRIRTETSAPGDPTAKGIIIR